MINGGLKTRNIFQLITYIDKAVNGVTYVLPGGDEDAGHHQQHDGGLVVEPEHIVVDTHRVKLQEL